jgi:hypothetical protein
MTIDNLLLKIVNFSSKPIEETLSARDCKVLKNLSAAINSRIYVTENQGQLIIKILRENSEKIPDFREEILAEISSPSWSRDFRQLEQIKKLFIEKNEEHELEILIEITYNQEIRKILQNLAKNVTGLVYSGRDGRWCANLTEHNIVQLYETLMPLGFDVDSTITAHYETIKSWSKTEVEQQFLITNITHPNFQKAITSDLGIDTDIDRNIINDRSIRYKYTTENPRNFGENLTENIANRANTKIWVDKNQHTLEEVFASLIQLKRMPVLVVFDTLVNSKYLENLENLSKSVKNAGVSNNVGIYFRLPNDELGKKFNSIIADNQYNKKLDSDLIVAAVSSGKIPKFFLKNTWQPMSVIALDTKMGLRHGKTSVYTNCCDLIIEYADEPSLLEKRLVIK